MVFKNSSIFGIAGKDNHDVVTIVLHKFEDGIDRSIPKSAPLSFYPVIGLSIKRMPPCAFQAGLGSVQPFLQYSKRSDHLLPRNGILPERTPASKALSQ